MPIKQFTVPIGDELGDHNSNVVNGLELSWNGYKHIRDNVYEVEACLVEKFVSGMPKPKPGDKASVLILEINLDDISTVENAARELLQAYEEDKEGWLCQRYKIIRDLNVLTNGSNLTVRQCGVRMAEIYYGQMKKEYNGGGYAEWARPGVLQELKNAKDNGYVE